MRAAFAIRDWAADEGVELRVGINAGEALVTVDARPEAGETMAAGDVVNTAARLQSAAPVNGILVGEQTYRATERAIEYRESRAGRGEGKGRAGRRPGRRVRRDARIGVDRVHGAALVGRAREVALLEDALARTLGGAIAAARHARRRSRDRQEPARPRAVRARSSAIPS